MWKYLQKVLGRSSDSYEDLMKSRDVSDAIAPGTVADAASILKPLIKPCYPLKLDHKELSQQSPVDKKGIPVPYYGSIQHPEFALHLFLNTDKYLKDLSNIVLQVESSQKVSDNHINSHNSLPIWEELIHRDLHKHREIVDLAPKQPWSLYKLAKTSLTLSHNESVVGGYPQWIVNNIDYRDIESLQFLFQLYMDGDDRILYFFYNRQNNQTQFFIQKR
jgi:hypothetical protein